MSDVAHFKVLPDAIIQNTSLWRTWYDSESPELLDVPVIGCRLSAFQKLCVIKVCGVTVVALCLYISISTRIDDALHSIGVSRGPYIDSCNLVHCKHLGLNSVGVSSVELAKSLR